MPMLGCAWQRWTFLGKPIFGKNDQKWLKISPKGGAFNYFENFSLDFLLVTLNKI